MPIELSRECCKAGEREGARRKRSDDEKSTINCVLMLLCTCFMLEIYPYKHIHEGVHTHKWEALNKWRDRDGERTLTNSRRFMTWCHSCGTKQSQHIVSTLHDASLAHGGASNSNHTTRFVFHLDEKRKKTLLFFYSLFFVINCMEELRLRRNFFIIIMSLVACRPRNQSESLLMHFQWCELCFICVILRWSTSTMPLKCINYCENFMFNQLSRCWRTSRRWGGDGWGILCILCSCAS